MINNQEASFTPAQGKRIAETVLDFESHGRNRGGVGNKFGAGNLREYQDYWIEITGDTSGHPSYPWKHKLRVSHNSFIDHPDGVVSSSSSPDTRAYYLGDNTLEIGKNYRAIVEMDEYGVVTYTIAAAGGGPANGPFFVRVKVNGGGTGAPTYDVYPFDTDVSLASPFDALNLNPDYDGVTILNITNPLAPICSRARWSTVINAADPSPITDPATNGSPNLGTALYVDGIVVLWDLPEFLDAGEDCD